LAPAGAASTIKYDKAQTITSTTCAAIKTDTVEIITAIKNAAGGYDLSLALTARATDTSIRHYQCVDSDVNRTDTTAN
jgi:hypothetical protein